MAKKVLKEAVVRRFQKLANVAPINEMYANEGYMNEEEEGAELAPTDDMADMDDMGGEAEVEMPQSDLDAIQAALPALQNLVDMAGGASEDMDDMGDMDDMDAMPADGEEGEELEDEDAEEAIMEALRGISYVPSKSEVVNEVAKRVARRLKTAKLHEAKLNRALGKRR